jgi:hypothetical protein
MILPDPVKMIDIAVMIMGRKVKTLNTIPRIFTPLSRSTQQQHFVSAIFIAR